MKYQYYYNPNILNDSETQKVNKFVGIAYKQLSRNLITEKEYQFRIAKFLLKNYSDDLASEIYANLRK